VIWYVLSACQQNNRCYEKLRHGQHRTSPEAESNRAALSSGPPRAVNLGLTTGSLSVAAFQIGIKHRDGSGAGCCACPCRRVLAAVRCEERAQLSGLTEHVLDLSPYAARTYFWRWNNRKGIFGRNFLSDADLKLALE
jgi:hypothetical protein